MGTDNYPLSFHMAINHLSYPLKGFFCAAIWFRSKPSQYGKASKRQAFFVAFKASESACQILPHKRRQVRALFLAKEKSIWLKELKSKWLHAALRGKVCRLGCSICSLAEAGGPWACFEQKPLEVRLHHLKRHERSKGHQEAIAKHQGVQSAGFAPDLQLFQDSLHRMRSGGSARDGGVYSDKKQQIRWCLAEAVMDKGRQILRDASAIAVTRDERKGRLLIRWRACTPNLTSASGVLSFHPVDGSAEDLAESTKKAVQEYCRLRICLPRGFKDPQPGEDDPAAEANIKKKQAY